MDFFWWLRLLFGFPILEELEWEECFHNCYREGMLRYQDRLVDIQQALQQTEERIRNRRFLLRIRSEWNENKTVDHQLVEAVASQCAMKCKKRVSAFQSWCSFLEKHQQLKVENSHLQMQTSHLINIKGWLCMHISQIEQNECLEAA